MASVQDARATSGAHYKGRAVGLAAWARHLGEAALWARHLGKATWACHLGLGGLGLVVEA